MQHLPPQDEQPSKKPEPITITIDAEHVDDLLTAALAAGSIHYWGCVYEDHGDPLDAGYLVIAEWSDDYDYNDYCNDDEDEDEDEDEDRKKPLALHHLDRDALARGLKLLIERTPSRFADADSVAGDLFIQYCVFGEEKYA